MKDIQKINNSATNPIRDTLAASLKKVVMERQVALFMAALIPIITDTDGMEITTKTLKFNKEYFRGKAQITDSLPRSVPTLVIDSKVEEVPMKWISTGIEITREDRALYAANKNIKFANKSKAAYRILAEEEEKFLKTGVVELGVDGFNSTDGINIVTTLAKWATLTGAQILEEIRKGWSAHTMDGRFEAESFWLDKQLHDLLYKPYSDKEPKSTLEILEGRKWFKKIVSIPQYGTATIVEDNEECFGYVPAVIPRLGEEYKNETTDVHILEEHISGLVVLQPQSITRIEGAL